jgi:NAD(P)-dependent dehydrogenase (short-subunit alcohol dehydrogenase family)
MSQINGAVLITGATSDIGAAIALKLKLAGYTPVLVGRNEEKLHSIAGKLSIETNHCYVVDNSNCDDLPSHFKTIVSEIGKLSGMVICAGSHEIRPLKVQTAASLFNTFQQNTLSALMFAKCFASSLYSNNNSSLVFVSSTAALVGEVGLSAYSAAKGALISSTKSLAVELAPRRLRVNCISPGWVETAHAREVKAAIGQAAVDEIQRLYPLGFGEPEDIANAAEFLLSDKSRWITGQNIIVDGGRTLL